MIKIFNTCLFITYLFGLGYSLTRFLTNNFESVVIRMGVGLGAFVVLGVTLNVFGIPLDWKIFLLIALLPAFIIRFLTKQDGGNPNSLASNRWELFVVVLIFLSQLFIYTHGPFQYPYLEDDDSWAHAAGIKYIATEKNLNVSPGEFHYLNPYPPGYDLIFGILHQTSPSLYWTLKFFNGFIIALGFLFFFFFAWEFSCDLKKSLLATLILACLPCYLSHFIWAHALAVTLFFPAFYTFLKAREDKRFIIPSSILVASIFLVQPTTCIKFAIFCLILFCTYIIITKRISRNFMIIAALATLISLLWWGPVVIDTITNRSVIAFRSGLEIAHNAAPTASAIRGLFHPQGGTATMAYSLNDFLFPPGNNFINNPIGIGLPLCVLIAFGILVTIYQIITTKEAQRRIYYWTIFLWSIFTFLGINSMTFNLPVGLFAFRFWSIFAIPAAFLATETISKVILALNKPKLRFAALTVTLSLILFTSGFYKYKVNVSEWSWGVYWNSPEELAAYIWLRNHLPAGTKVFAFTDNLLVIGHDMKADFWSESYKKKFEDAINLNVHELHNVLCSAHFQYLIVGEREIRKFGPARMRQKLAELSGSTLFKPVQKMKQDIIIYRILQ